MVVMKFGGTSIGNGQRMLAVGKIAARERERQPIIVVSAISQVTNLLVDMAARITDRAQRAKVDADIEQLRRIHHQAAKALKLEPGAEKKLLALLDSRIDELQSTLNHIASLGELTPKGSDMIICFGERLSIHLVAAALEKNGLAAQAIEASELLVTDGNFGNAQPLLAACRDKMKPVLTRLAANRVVPVITGYMGATTQGLVTTLGRGGSDYSATIIGHCVGAQEVWIWTDVDGVMTADPKDVKSAHTVKELSYDEAAELSYFGAKVLHPRTMAAASISNIPIFIKNTLNPSAPGTKISNAAYLHPDGVKAMTVLKRLSLITIQGKGMQGVLGIAAKVFTALAEHKVNVLFISQASSENNISLVTGRQDGGRAVEALTAAFRTELLAKKVETVREEPDVAMIAVIGEGMRSHNGVAGRIFSALGRADINVIAIAQGSSERNISFVVRETDAGPALQSIHDELHLAKSRKVTA
ncbi:MAG TPA: aspartate kinase [Candidatus Saccharimonadales bacterium]